MIDDIKIAIFDVDGTLTDGMYQVSSDGIISKNFYTRDFAAIEKLLKLDFIVFIMSASDDKVLLEKCKLNGFLQEYPYNLFIFMRVSDKLGYVNYLRGRLAPSNIREKVGDFSWDKIAYMGDAENDLEAMQRAAISVCPCDAEKPILEIADYISPYKGGHGAVADFVRYLLETNNG